MRYDYAQSDAIETWPPDHNGEAELIAGCFYDIAGGDDAAKANAAYIVHACNSYPALAEKAEKLAKALEELADYCDLNGLPSAADKATQALADYRSE